MILAQSRAGAAVAIAIGALFGLVYVPSHGWGLYLTWYLPFATLMLARQPYFHQLVLHQGATPRTLRRIAATAAFTGWLGPASVPLFSQPLIMDDLGVLTILAIGWACIGVSVLAVQPRIYAAFLFACFAAVFLAWMQHAERGEMVMVGVGMLLGGSLMVRLSYLILAQLRDAVDASVENASLVSQLRQALERQQEAQRARSRFLGAASHDLRQPVQALLFLSDIFRKSTDTARRDAMALQIARTGESIDGMFRHLVDFAQIDAGTMKAVVQPVQLERLVQAAITGYAEKCAARGLRFHLEVDAPLTVAADPVLLERVLRNFLDNAFKYSLAGQITLRVQRGEGTAEISVQDQGVGMSAEDRAQAFKAFYRGRSATQAEAEGIGLGLAICKHMADLMQAPLELQSHPGQGTRVAIRLPLVQQEAHAPTNGLESPPADAPLNGLCIAVIENDRLAREALCAWLREAGARVVGGAGVTQVQEVLRRQGASPDIIVADFRLGEGTGLDAIATLRRAYGDVPALVVSGEHDIAERDLGVPVLQKPVTPERLLEGLQRELRGRLPA